MHELIAIAVAWLLYGLMHSILAAHWMKSWVQQSWPTLLSGYRLVFNFLSLVLLVPPLWLAYRYTGAPLWAVPSWLANLALLIAVIGFGWSLRWYDGATFLGLRQWRKGIGPDDQHEAFTLSPFHRVVRHPWYFLALLVLWTRELNAAWLVSAAMITLYFFVGSRLEEQKLLAIYGEAYRQYQQRVPGLIPNPWRFLRREQAHALEQMARTLK